MRRGVAMVGGIVAVGAGAAIALGQAGSWVTQSPVAPARGTVLYGVACPAADSCVAVGSGARAKRAVVERWNGRSWSAMNAPRAGRFPYLYAVDCSSTSFCMAVGGRASGVGVAALAVRWNGSRWTSLPVPLPRGLTSIPIYRRFDLSGVACRTSSDCTAVGAFQAGSRAFDRPLVYRWNGRRWRQQASPTGSRFLTRLDAVSCPTATSCLAVGQSFTDKIGRYSRAFAESWDGKGWRVEHPPTITGRNQSNLTAVSCSAARECEAVGGDVRDALATRWSGGKWTEQPTPAKAQRFQSLMLNGVFCASASSCVAVGFPGGLDRGDGLIARWDGSGWTNQALPAPTTLETLGLGCFDIASCEVVGARFKGGAINGGGSEVPVAYGPSAP